MTINDLQESLIHEISVILKDITLIDAEGNCQKIKGYAQELPINTVQAGWSEENNQESGEDALFPYFCVQVTDVEYEDIEAVVKIWIIFGICDSSPLMTGWKTIMTIVEHLTNRFRINTIVDDYYRCDKKMKVAYPEQGDWPHFFAGIEMTWHLPGLMEEI